MHCSLLFALSLAVQDQAKILPTEFTENVIFLLAETDQGQPLRLYTDTGGGLFLLATAAARLGLEPVDKFVDPPRLMGAPGYPGKVFVMSAEDVPIKGDFDGMLGQAWFGDRVWTFDYPNTRLEVHSDSLLTEDGPHRVTLGFKTDDTGKRLTHFPSIEAEIDGETYPFLFDTGAQVNLTEGAREALGTQASRLGTSFVTESLFEVWRAAHPDWPVIEDADTIVPGSAMIRVASVTIAGHAVGPVWFTRRPDRNFHEYMSGFMNRRVDGALGGSLFQYFRITVDYPRARAEFELPSR